MSSSLVSCEWLYSKIQSGDLGDVLILDVSWSSKRDEYEEYKKKHIEGALHINVLDAENTDVLVRNLPTPEHFTELARKAGVKKSSHVIVYSNSDRSGFFLGARGWWTFKVFGLEKVSILDGGLTKWEDLGYPVTDKLPTDIPEGDFEASKTPNSFFRSYDEVVGNIESEKFQLVDSRASEMFEAGQIPGAKNLAMGNLIDNTNKTLKSKEELLAEYTKAGLDVNRPIVGHCTSGMSSCTIAFVTQLLNQNNTGVFMGGYKEWTSRQNQQ